MRAAQRRTGQLMQEWATKEEKNRQRLENLEKKKKEQAIIAAEVAADVQKHLKGEHSAELDLARRSLTSAVEKIDGISNGLDNQRNWDKMVRDINQAAKP